MKIRPLNYNKYGRLQKYFPKLNMQDPLSHLFFHLLVSFWIVSKSRKANNDTYVSMAFVHRFVYWSFSKLQVKSMEED